MAEREIRVLECDWCGQVNDTVKTRRLALGRSEPQYVEVCEVEWAPIRRLYKRGRADKNAAQLVAPV